MKCYRNASVAAFDGAVDYPPVRDLWFKLVYGLDTNVRYKHHSLNTFNFLSF